MPVRHDFLGSPVDAYSFDEAAKEIVRRIEEKRGTSLVHFVNVAKIVKARKNEELRETLWGGDLVLADGKPLLLFGRWLHIELPTRVNGTDLMEKLLEVSEERAFNVYLLGARQEILEACVEKIKLRHPGIRICGYRNGYFSDDEVELVIDEINRTRPDILFVGMGTPQKELFAHRNRERLAVAVVEGVGGSFDVVAGLVTRAPVWMQRAGLEWFYRVLQEPGRLFWRYFSTNSVFLLIFMKQVLFPRKAATVRAGASRRRPGGG